MLEIHRLLFFLFLKGPAVATISKYIDGFQVLRAKHTKLRFTVCLWIYVPVDVLVNTLADERIVQEKEKTKCCVNKGKSKQGKQE